MDTQFAVMLSSKVPPEATVAVARSVEDAGFSRIWLTEDYYRKGGFASCGAVLGSTRRLSVGLGVASLFMRHPTTLAMEVATLRRMYPGRFEIGVGLGSQRALNGSQRMPAGVIGSTRERLALLDDLVAGSEVTWSDEFDTVGQARLDHAATTETEIWLGAEGPDMLALAAQHAGGVVFSAFSTRTYLDWAMPILRQHGGCPTVVYLHVSVHEDPAVAADTARDILVNRLQAGYSSSSMRRSGVWETVAPLLGAAPEVIRSHLSDELVSAFVVFGTPDRCRRELDRFVRAGVDEIALAPTMANDPDRLGDAIAALASVNKPTGRRVGLLRQSGGGPPAWRARGHRGAGAAPTHTEGALR